MITAGRAIQETIRVYPSHKTVNIFDLSLFIHLLIFENEFYLQSPFTQQEESPSIPRDHGIEKKEAETIQSAQGMGRLHLDSNSFQSDLLIISPR